MQRKFITNLAFLLFLNLLIKPIWIFGIDRTVQNTVGAETYGHYYALFNFSFLLNILLDLGITNFNNRNIAQYSHLVQKHLSGIVALRMVLAGAYILVSLLAGLLIGYGMPQLWMLGVLLVNQVMVSFILYLRSNLSGLHLFRIDSTVSVLDRFIMIVLCGILLWRHARDGDFRIEWFVGVQTVAYALTAAVALGILARRTGLRRLSWDPVFALVILRKSYPFALLILLMTFYNRIDSVMLERMLHDGSRQAGIYAQAYRLLEASSMVPFLFAGLLLPIFARMIRQRQPIRKLLRLSYTLLVIPAFVGGIACYVFRNEIMHLLYVEHIDESSRVFGFLMIGFTAVSMSYLYGTLLTANGNLRQLNMLAAGAMVLNIVLNLILIPRLFAFGAAIASLVTQGVMAVAQAFLSKRLFSLPFDTRFLVTVAVFLAGSIGLTVWLHGLAFSWLVNLGLAVGACCVLALALRLIRPRALFAVVSGRREEW